MAATKKTASSSSESSTTTDVPKKSSSKDKAPEPVVAGVSEALKFPTTADLNPAYVIADE